MRPDGSIAGIKLDHLLEISESPFQALSIPPLKEQGGLRESESGGGEALALNSNLADANSALGWIKATYDWDWAAADACIAEPLNWIRSLRPRV